MTTIRTCAHCGKPLAANRKRFCSPECLAEGLKKPLSKCEVCGREFKPARKGARFCGLGCFNASRVQKARSSSEPISVSGARWIPLTQGKFVLVDASHYEDLSRFTWCAVKVRSNARGEVFYAKRTDIGVYLHRYLTNPLAAEEVDHRNGDSLDCRIDNLLVCDKSGNGQNRLALVGKLSGYKGVHITSSGIWVVRYCNRGVEEYGGTFRDKEEAARKYDEIVRLRGHVNSTFNFPRTGERSAVTGEVQS